MESNYKKLTAKITKLEKSKMKKEEKIKELQNSGRKLENFPAAGFHIPLDEFNGKRPVRSHLHAMIRQKRLQLGNDELHLLRIGSLGRRRSQNAHGLHGNSPAVPAKLLGFGNQRRPLRRKQPVIGSVGWKGRGRILPPCSGASHAHPCKR